MIKLLTNSLSRSAPIHSTQPRILPPTEDSAEVLSEVSDDLPLNAPPATGTTLNPHISITANLLTSTTESPLSSYYPEPTSITASCTIMTQRQDH